MPKSWTSAAPKGSPPHVLAQPPMKRTNFVSRHPNGMYAFEGALAVAKIAADASCVPGLGAAVAAVQKLVSVAKDVAVNNDKCDQIAEQAVRLASGMVDIVRVRPMSYSLLGRFLAEFLEQLERIIVTMESLPTNRSLLKTLWQQGKLSAALSENSEALKRCQQNFTTFAATLAATQETVLSSHLSPRGQDFPMMLAPNMSPSLPYINASFNEDDNIRACLEHTRTAILHEIFDRLTSPSSPSSPSSHVVWLQGSAGSGKSTIAKTVSILLAQNLALAGSFFFSQDVDTRSRRENVFATLASQLAIRHPDFCSALQEVVSANPALAHTVPDQQLAQLLLVPLSKVDLSSSGPLIFVLDALDECGKDQGTAFLYTLLRHLDSFPSSIRFFITSRPEAPLRTLLSQLNISKHIHVVDIDKDSDAAGCRDVETYLSVRLQELNKWPPFSNNIRTLATLANGVFQFAAVAANTIEDALRKGLPCTEAFNLVLGRHHHQSTHPHSFFADAGVLDNLYLSIIDRAYYSKPNSKNIAHPILKTYHLIIGVIVCVREPVSIDTLANLINVSPSDARIACAPLSSIIFVPEQHHLPIRIRHFSFIEFITGATPTLSKHHPELVVDAQARNDVETTLASGCLKVMNNLLLRPNLLQLDSHNFLCFNAKIDGLSKKVEKHIPHYLRYACSHWASHLACGNMTTETVDLFEIWCREKIMYWLELLSWCGRIDLALPLLKAAEGSYRAVLNCDSTTAKLLFEAQRFITRFHLPISISAGHVYFSALPFTPFGSLWTQYQHLASDAVQMTYGKELEWKNLLWASPNGDQYNAIQSIVFSRTGTQAVSVSGDTAVRVWATETGVERLTLHGHRFTCAVFSADSTQIFTASRNGEIIIWSAANGERLLRLEGHRSEILSLGVSHDGSCFASGSVDGTIRIWSAQTGAMIRSFKGLSNATSIAFAPDCSRVAFVSENEDILILSMNVNTIIRCKMMWCVVFSDDGAQIASGGDGRVRVWHAETGAMVGSFSTNSVVRSVAFSPNGAAILCALDNGTVQLRSIETGAMLLNFQHPSGTSCCWVSFSPSGMHMMSGASDGIVRFWSINTVGPSFSNPLHSPPPIRPDTRPFIHLKPRRLSAIRTIEAKAGGLVAQEDLDGVEALDISADGRWIGFGLSNGTIRIYPLTGRGKKRSLQARRRVHTMTFSPDGNRIIAGLADGRIQVWSTTSGRSLQDIQIFNTVILSVALSDDGTLIYLEDGVDGRPKWKSVGLGDVVKPPSQSTVPCPFTISQDSQWVMFNGLPVCFLPQTVYRHAFSSSTLALILSSRIPLILNFDSLLKILL